ncbi:MAG: MFS transporter [Syntrophobacterales bacterium]|nr:MAG: MFS transporter [Syntrophobacterales bacterium]
MNMVSVSPTTLVTLLRVFIPFALAYFLSYLFRVVNAIIAPNLAADLNIGPADLGLLTSAYFVSFAAFQLPLGVLLDRFGPRRVAAGLLVFAAAGAMMFAMAGGLSGLFVGRALIGLGVSAGYMAAIKAYTLWFPPQQWPQINGLHLAAGGIGALSATLPVEFALTYADWRGLFIVLSILSAIVASAIFGCVPEQRQETGQIRLSDALRGIGQVFTSPLFWRVTPLTVTSQVAFMSIQGLWAGPWLRDVAGMDRAGIAGVLFWTAAAMTAGYVAIGFITERLSRSGIKPLTTAVWGMLLFMAVQALIMAGPVRWPTALWMLFGFIGTTGVIPYPALAMSFPSQLAGRVSTGLNVLVFVGAFAAQWGIGAVIALFPVTAAGHYSPQGYQASLAILLGMQALCLVWYFLAGRQ